MPNEAPTGGTVITMTRFEKSRTHFLRRVGLLLAILSAACGFTWRALASEVGKPLSPTRLEAWLTSVPNHQDSFVLDRQLLFGAIAFNSPYLFGGAALRDHITCVACHGSDGPSGPALHISFDKKIPDLFEQDWDDNRNSDRMPDSFIKVSIRDEFSGPQPSDYLVRGMGAYLRQIANARHYSGSVRFDAKMLAGLAILVLRDDLAHQQYGDIDFLIETARFALGEAVVDLDAASQLKFTQFNRQLKELGERLGLTLQDAELREIDCRLAPIQSELLEGLIVTVTNP